MSKVPTAVTGASGPTDSSPSVVEVIAGDPSAEEMAIVVSLVAAAARAGATSAPREVSADGVHATVSSWASPSRMVRRRFTLRNRPGPSAWIFSGRS